MKPGGQDPRVVKVILTVIWFAQLAGALVLYFFLRQPDEILPTTPPPSAVDFVGLMFLAASVVVRWMILPRQLEPTRLLTVFIVGIALAETCSILAIFINVVWVDEFFALGVVGIVQYAPFLMPRVFQARRSEFTTAT